MGNVHAPISFKCSLEATRPSVLSLVVLAQVAIRRCTVVLRPIVFTDICMMKRRPVAKCHVCEHANLPIDDWIARSSAEHLALRSKSRNHIFDARAHILHNYRASRTCGRNLVTFEVHQPCCSRISAKSRSTLHRVTLIAAEFGCVAHANHNVASSGPGIGQRAL